VNIIPAGEELEAWAVQTLSVAKNGYYVRFRVEIMKTAKRLPS
jgi:hypothetical protein